MPTIVGTNQDDDCYGCFRSIALTTGLFETSSRFLSILCRRVDRFGGIRQIGSAWGITCKLCYIKDMVTHQLVTFRLLFPLTLFCFIQHRTIYFCLNLPSNGSFCNQWYICLNSNSMNKYDVLFQFINRCVLYLGAAPLPMIWSLTIDSCTYIYTTAKVFVIRNRKILFLYTRGQSYKSWLHIFYESCIYKQMK
jgi:hypothetical protein